jgi:hypothetical protein
MLVAMSPELVPSHHVEHLKRPPAFTGTGPEIIRTQYAQVFIPDPEQPHNEQTDHPVEFLRHSAPREPISFPIFTHVGNTSVPVWMAGYGKNITVLKSHS